jgi:hypothetical protein
MKEELKITENFIYDIYKKSYTTKELRGKDRQHTINQAIVNSLLGTENYVGCNFKEEIKVDSVWPEDGEFRVDICVYKDGKLIEIILIKAICSNWKQNKNNYYNNMSGEVNRIDIDDIKVTFVNFLPNCVPYFTKGEIISGFEKTKVEFIFKPRSCYNKNVSEIYVTFDIENVQSCSSKKEVKEMLMKSNPISNVELHINNYIKPTIIYHV